MDMRRKRKEDLAKAAVGNGLLGFDVAGNIGQFMVGIENPKTAVFEVEGLGQALLVAGKSTGDGEPFHGGTVDGFYALVRHGDPRGNGPVLAYLRAGVIRPTKETVSWGAKELHACLTDMADQSWHVHPERISQVRRTVGALDTVFAGGAMAMLDALSRDLELTPEGSGARLLQGALGTYAALRRVKVGSLAYTPEPRQHMGKAGAIHTGAFKDAARAQRAAIDAAVLATPTKAGGKPPRPIAWRTAMKAKGYDPGILELGSMHADHDPRLRDEGPRERAMRLTGVVMNMVGMRGAWTKAKDGPPPLEPHRFPKGFDVGVAGTFPALDPRREMWSHLPEAVVAVTVLPTGRWEDGVAGFGRKGPDGRPGRPSLVLKVEFANGTELEMPSEHMLWGRRVMEIVPDLLDEAGAIVLDNPFAPGFKTMAMNDTLAVNLAMLFSSDPHGIEEIEETRFERP